MRPFAGDERAREREIQDHRKTQVVEPDGTTRKYMFLPGEILSARANKKSADAVVALKPVERREERRAEESRKTNQSEPGKQGEQRTGTRRRCNYGNYPSGTAKLIRWILI